MKHRWMGQRMGGDPAEAGSYEYVKYCRDCGKASNGEDNDEECTSAGIVYECHEHGAQAGDHCPQCVVHAYIPSPSEVSRAQYDELKKLRDEVTEGFNRIFYCVPQASDDTGRELTLSDKIQVLCNEYVRLKDEYSALSESFVQQSSDLHALHNQCNPYVIPSFVKLMDDIGRLGFEKYGDKSFHAGRVEGDHTRRHARTTTLHITAHASGHIAAYELGEKHDKLHTLKHQLAAVAFNAMMEYWYAELEDEEPHEP